MLSIEGVADPKITGMLQCFAFIIARSLAEYLKPSCCLYETSFSSSTMIMPKFLKGENIADLVPKTIFAFELRIAFQVMSFSFSVHDE